MADESGLPPTESRTELPSVSPALSPGAERMLEVTVPLADLRPIPGGVAKAKARMVTVVREVALDGGAIEVAS